jgi:hypothetical protein
LILATDYTDGTKAGLATKGTESAKEFSHQKNKKGWFVIFVFFVAINSVGLVGQGLIREVRG